MILRPKLSYCYLVHGKIIVLNMLLLVIGFIFFREYIEYVLLFISILFLTYFYRVFLERSKKYHFQNDQLIYERGIFTIRKDFVELYRVKDISEFRPFWMRLLGQMAISFHTSDHSMRNFSIQGFSKQDIVQDIRVMVERARTEKGVFEVD